MFETSDLCNRVAGDGHQLGKDFEVLSLHDVVEAIGILFQLISFGFSRTFVFK
jgi:hypothetical protein